MAGKEKVTGWSRHQHFGLRKEWLELYLQEQQEWELSGLLGNRQVQSFKVWLRTTGLQDKRGKETFSGGAFPGVWPGGNPALGVALGERGL
ncbi:hypothetical protein SAMN02745218_01071 [Desulfofundulus australicus DSM 11792]|uniref:Uncharacterized protein n=1 Tax=Desulfofundulus australicus DSM 11792 TaxID=1121425 RepID=A0A1M4XF68_9FIRM|nr:hypothetical protein [Desulfofundulus australicus]SHE92041.1 hypothetical protein SAMN02745218_01071 [Desulfofundulus australicus DSM 11792]